MRPHPCLSLLWALCVLIAGVNVARHFVATQRCGSDIAIYRLPAGGDYTAEHLPAGPLPAQWTVTLMADALLSLNFEDQLAALACDLSVDVHVLDPESYDTGLAVKRESIEAAFFASLQDGGIAAACRAGTLRCRLHSLVTRP